MNSGLFSIAELKLLVDAVEAAQFITEKKSEALIKKLSSLTSTHNSEKLCRTIVLAQRAKSDNEEIFENIDRCHEAINRGKQIKFLYFDYNEDKHRVLRNYGEEYALSPYCMTWEDAKYYVIGYSVKHKKIITFRVDRMNEVRITDDMCMPAPKGFNAADYVNKVFRMFDDKMVTVTLKCRNELWRHSHDCNVQAILVMIYMGFRIGEITSITTDSVNLREGYIVGGIKTEAGKARIVPFPKNIPEIQGFVASWLRRAIPGERLFPMTEHTFRNKIFYGTLIELGMVDAHVDDKGAPVFHTDRHLTPHSTRHTFASLSVAAGMRPERLQHIIGHASFKTTADYYVHVDHGALISEMGKLLRDCS